MNINENNVPSLNEIRQEMDRSPTWSERQVHKFLSWTSAQEDNRQMFIGGLLMPLFLGYAVMGHNLSKITIIDLLVLPFAYFTGTAVLISLKTAKIFTEVD